MRLQYLCFVLLFFIKNSSMPRCLDVLEGQKLLSRKTRRMLDIFCLFVLYFYWKYWTCIIWIFHSRNCECLSSCKLGLYQNLSFDSADIAFTIRWSCRIHNRQTVRAEPGQLSTAFLIQVEGERCVWSPCLYRLLSLPGQLPACEARGELAWGEDFHLTLCDLQW